jgi:hypothetical protein
MPSGIYCIGGWIGPQSWSGRFGGKIKLLPLLGIKALFLGHPGYPACSLVTIPTTLLQLPPNTGIIKLRRVIRAEHASLYEIHEICKQNFNHIN